MGVHGLTTYLRENKESLFKQLRFEASDKDPTNLVVDAWSFIYVLIHCGDLEWVYGGEYGELYGLIGVVVRAWLSVGLRPHFVFDGPLNPLKIGTVVSRMKDNNIRRSELFFRTPPSARSHPRFLDQNRFFPPLASEAVVEAIKSLVSEGLSVELYFAEGEGDLYAVELAGKLNGYVIGMDSDFVVLNAEGYKGYIPLDDIVWDTSALPNLASQRSREGSWSGFQPIKGKRVNRTFGTNGEIIPPTGDVSQVSLTCSVTCPAALASHLHLPVSLLPLLGALVGNDFSATQSPGFGKGSVFFDRKVSLSQRITEVSSVISDATSNHTCNDAEKPEGRDGVVDLTQRVVRTLLQGATDPTPEKEAEIIDNIVESTLQYALPTREDDALRSPGPLFLPGDVCPHGNDLGKVVRQRYLDGYHAGNVPPDALNPLHTGTMWARPFLEDPRKETVQCSIGRPIRKWIYAILDDGVGLPMRQRIEGSETEGSRVRVRKVIVEYIRRGSDFGPEDLEVGFLQELMGRSGVPLEGPIQLEPEPTRLHLFLIIIGAEGAREKLRNIPPEQILPVLAVRWVVSVLHDRVTESGGSKDRLAEKWTKSEVRALLLAFIRPTAQYASPAAPEIRERHVQLTAQVLVSIEVIAFLAQVLLLDLDRSVPLNLVARFSGKRFHQLLNFGHTGASSSEVLDPLMDVVVTGLHAEAFAEETSNKRGVGMGYGTEEASPWYPPRGGKSNRRGGRRGFF